MKIRWKRTIDSVHSAEYKITVPAEEINLKLDEYIESVKDRVLVPGFRISNAPKQKIITTIGESKIIEDMIKWVQNDAFDELMKRISDKPVGPPVFTDGDMSLGEDYEFTVDFAKEIEKIDPSHEKHMPIMGDLSGGPMEIHEKLTGDLPGKSQAKEYMPDGLKENLPDEISSQTKKQISALRNPLEEYMDKKPSPGETDTAEKLLKTTEPEELIVDSPHEKLDKKAEPPGEEMEEKLPQTEFKPETDIQEPDVDDKRETEDLAVKIDTPSLKSSDDSTPEDPVQDIEDEELTK